ncbi:MAG: hypothetical protein CFE21_09345 [Bacteroidetes bacterium B1(2017)]|nr:MAG: hypothetical protein CFE21_09345 [Bacteroidetes bacterium B1(2017)]
MDLIQEYIELTKTCASTNYSDKESVHLHNKSVKMMYEIVEKVAAKKSIETIDEFAKLLDITDNKTNVWAAIHILERFMPMDTIGEKAFEIIKLQSEGESADAMGFKIWLDNFRKK